MQEATNRVAEAESLMRRILVMARNLGKRGYVDEPSLRPGHVAEPAVEGGEVGQPPGHCWGGEPLALFV